MTSGPTPHRGPASTPVPAATVAIVVPAYNEAERLDSAAFIEHLQANPTHRLVFVDDASTDSTVSTVHGLQHALPDRIELVECAANGGKAEAVRTGVQHLSLIHI